jgi:hypothetical protein
MQELDVRFETKISGGITDGCIPNPFPYPWPIPQPYPTPSKQPREV